MECPEFLRPRLRLFLSADIVGSTALKQTRGPVDVGDLRKHYAWFSVIQGFYVVARQSLSQCWAERRGKWPDNDDCFGDEPELWKTIGDEVIFEKVLTDHRQLAVTLHCWVEAVEEMRNFVKLRNSSLDIKYAAWLAGFPVRNKEVVLSHKEELENQDDYNKSSGLLLNEHYANTESSQLSIDYVGPSIDIGFRVASYATPRKFVLSVGIPYILALTSPTQSGLIGDFRIFYDGSRPLKGVLGGVNYPLFWIDLSKEDSIDYHEDRLTGHREAARDDIRRYCDAFYEEHDIYTHRPFIQSPTEQQISKKPEWWDELHSNLIKNFYLEDDSASEGPAEGADLGIDQPVDEDKWQERVSVILGLLSKFQEEDSDDKSS